MVVTASGEVHTNEGATVNDNDLDLCVTVQILDDTPAVLSLGQLCGDHGYSNEWTSGQNHISFKKKAGNTMQHGELRAYRCCGACQPDPPALPRVHPLHRNRRTHCERILLHLQQPHDVGVHAVEHWETSFKIPTKPETKNMRTSIEHGEARCVICRGVG